MNSLQEKSREIQALLTGIVEQQGIRVLFLSAFGYKFDSAFWIAVATDAERDKLCAQHELQQRLYAVFKETGYLPMIEDFWQKEINNPTLAYLKTPGITIESQETVDRQYQGNWYYCMK